MICPNCKCEYVAGITHCPDCKIPLVESLEEENVLSEEPSDEDMEEAIEDNFMPTAGDIPYKEELEELIERRRLIEETPVYKSKAEASANNRSGAFALLGCGCIGVIALLLNALGIISLPITGFSLMLMYVVMGCLFFAFLVSGGLSLYKLVELAPEVQTEKENIDKVVEYLKENKSRYTAEQGLEREEAYLDICKKAVSDIENEFTDLEPGFAYYVVDRFAGDLLDED